MLQAVVKSWFLLLLILVFSAGCNDRDDGDSVDKTRDLWKAIEAEKKVYFPPAEPSHLETDMKIVPQPDPQGWPQSAIHSRQNKQAASPAIEARVVGRWSDGASYFLLVSFENTTSRQGNMSINIYHFDKNDRMVDLSTQVFYFRPFQKYIRRYAFSRGNGEVRWVINVSE